MAEALTGKRLEILEFIGDSLRERGYPPSVREIGEAVGLTSSSTVHAHLAVLQREGYLRRDPTKPRAMEVRYDPSSTAAMAARPVRHVPLRRRRRRRHRRARQENVEELLPLPEDFTGTGSVFMLRVRGDSMIEAGIFDGDFVVVRSQPDADNGDVVVAGHPRRRGHGEDLRPTTGKGGPHPGQQRHGAHGVRRRRGDDLRQGRHRAAPALTRSPTSFPGRGRRHDAVTAPIRRAAPSEPSTPRRRARAPPRDTCSSGVWDSSGSPGPKLVAGTPAAARVATSVHPTLARAGAPVAADQGGESGSPSDGRAAGARRPPPAVARRPGRAIRRASTAARPRPRPACGRGRSGS